MVYSNRNAIEALTTNMTPKVAVSYLRVSTRGQAERGGGADEGFSIPAQRDANRKKALSMGAMVCKEFVDRGASAKSADRPELQKMLEYVKENADRVDYVIVHKVDRLARNRGDDIDIMRTLHECGVQLVSASESIDDTPAGMLLHGIMSAIAEFYSQNLANEVKKGLSEKVKNGGTVSKAPLGYLNIRRIDEKGREERTVIVDEERAPLVSADLWQRVQDVLASHVNGERTREHPHFLKGSLYCRNCGSRMIITYARSGSGVRYPYFVCAGRHSKREKGCKQKAVLIGEIERQVEQIYDHYSYPPAIRHHLEDFLQGKLKDEQKKYDTERDHLRREKDKLEHRREKLMEAHYNEAIPMDFFKNEQEKITKQLAAIDREAKAYEDVFT